MTNNMQKIIFFIFIFIFFSLPITANAGILPPCAATGNCGFCDIMYTVNAIMRWILYISGSGALMFFIYGGFKFIYAAGDKGRIDSAKKILWNTILGVAVVFLAWTGINLIISKATNGNNKVIFSNGGNIEWYNLCVKNSVGNECADKGDGYPCANFKSHCERGVCCVSEEKTGCDAVPACNWLAKQQGYTEFGFQCQQPSECGISYDQCEIAPNCIRNLCPDTKSNNKTITTVCCYKKE